MAYIGKSPTGTGVRSRYYFTASGGETSLSGASDSGATLSFTDGNYVDVSLNGVALVAGTDYNTTTANTIGGLTALSASDIVEILVYDIFTVADTVPASSGGTFTGGVTASGGLNVSTIKEATGTTTAMTIDSSGVITSSAGFANSASANFTAGSTLIAPTTNGIPSWANEIKVAFYNVSTAGTAVTLFRGYASGSVYTTNYEYMAMYADNSGNTTSDRSAGSDGGFSFYPWTAPANVLSGTVTFTHTTGYEYVAWGHAYIDNQPTYFITLQGRVSFPSAMTGIQIYNSTNFDSGQVRVLWR